MAELKFKKKSGQALGRINSDKKKGKTLQDNRIPAQKMASVQPGFDRARLIDARPSAVVQRNNAGLPDQLRSGIESLSGISMDNVQVHYNSSKPAQLSAHAYAQGQQIHVAPGQEKHLPHEAWHLVQQAQGRVKPTLRMKGKMNVNDDRDLENEADVMGARAFKTDWGSRETERELHGAHNQSRSGTQLDRGTTKLDEQVIQGFFTPGVLAGYVSAAGHWTQAVGAVTAFDAALTARGIGHGTNAKTALLNANATNKANKAKGTLSGEAFETMHWTDAGYPHVEGPGGANGIDIIDYDLVAGGPETDVREVKSALNLISAFSVIATAWHANPIILNQVELYYQGPLDDFNLAVLPINPAVPAFGRGGSEFFRVAPPDDDNDVDLVVNVRNPIGGAIGLTVYFDVF